MSRIFNGDGGETTDSMRLGITMNQKFIVLGYAETYSR